MFDKLTMTMFFIYIVITQFCCCESASMVYVVSSEHPCTTNKFRSVRWAKCFIHLVFWMEEKICMKKLKLNRKLGLSDTAEESKTLINTATESSGNWAL